uniref:Transcription elongation factor GreA n=1 Tax=uncultured Armatimonadetes bacterium TaxID=157466 RepID=A0A6J4HI76_9BACT|nr:Transcription elongation factor GreA [uncultured Armatimonadetes bacterium]
MQVMERDSEEIVLTSTGRRHIESELERLVTVERHEVTDRIRDAISFGDLTENAEYEAAKTAQAFVEGRILDLKRILSNARELTEAEVPTDQVGLGSMVTVRDLDFEDEWTLTLVSPFEADPDKDRISDHSPVGQALKGHKVGDSIEVKTPGGVTHYEIVQIGK